MNDNKDNRTPNLKSSSEITTSFVETDPSLEASKKWINKYLDGAEEQEDDFHKKYFDHGQTNTRGSKINLDEAIAEREPHDISIFEEKIEATPAEPSDSPMKPLKSTSDSIKEKKGSSDAEMNSKKQELTEDSKSASDALGEDQGAVGEKTKAKRKLSVQGHRQTSDDSIEETDEQPLQKKQGTNYLSFTGLLDGTGKNTIGGRPMPNFSSREINTKPVLDLQAEPKLRDRCLSPRTPVQQIKIKIFDLSSVKEKFMNKTDDEVRQRFLKTLQTQKRMAGSRPVIKEQKSNFSL